MKEIKKHLSSLIVIFNLVATTLKLDDEDRYWKLFRIKDKINWIRKELGYEPIQFIKGTNTMKMNDNTCPICSMFKHKKDWACVECMENEFIFAPKKEKKSLIRKRRKPNQTLDIE